MTADPVNTEGSGADPGRWPDFSDGVARTTTLLAYEALVGQKFSIFTPHSTGLSGLDLPLKGSCWLGHGSPQELPALCS